MALLWVASVQQKIMSKAPGLDFFLKEPLFLCKLQSTGSQSTTLDVEGLLLINLGKVNKKTKFLSRSLNSLSRALHTEN